MSGCGEHHLPILWRHGRDPMRRPRGQGRGAPRCLHRRGDHGQVTGTMTEADAARLLDRAPATLANWRYAERPIPYRRPRSRSLRADRLVVPQTDIPRSLNEPCRAGFLGHILHTGPSDLDAESSVYCAKSARSFAFSTNLSMRAPMAGSNSLWGRGQCAAEPNREMCSGRRTPSATCSSVWLNC